MSKSRPAADTKKALQEARELVAQIAKLDSNEAETRRRVERIFETCMGYEPFKHISREHAVHGVGDTEHCDFAIEIDGAAPGRPAMLVEIKKVGVDLSPKHLKQTASYAINMGCEWVLLTNSRQWALYHISFGQPPLCKLIESWDLLGDDLETLAQHFDLVSLGNLKRRGLDKVWQKRNVLTPNNLLGIILSDRSIAGIRRGLRQKTDVSVTPEEIVGALRRLLNETALLEMETVRISLPEEKPSAPRARKKTEAERSDEVAPHNTAPTTVPASPPPPAAA